MTAKGGPFHGSANGFKKREVPFRGSVKNLKVVNVDPTIAMLDMFPDGRVFRGHLIGSGTDP